MAAKVAQYEIMFLEIFLMASQEAGSCPAVAAFPSKASKRKVSSGLPCLCARELKTERH